MIQQLFEKLKKENLKLAAAESLTGGLFAASITSVPGASDIFNGSVVTYANKAKVSIGVDEETLKTEGAISKRCAKEMAQGVKKMFNADVAISFTGNAGPGASEEKPVGLVFISIIIEEACYNYRLSLDGDRAMIREQCVNFAIKTLEEKLDELNSEKDGESFEEKPIVDAEKTDSGQEGE